MSSTDTAEELAKLKKKLNTLQSKLRIAEENGNYDRASDLKFGAIPDIESKIKALEGDGGSPAKASSNAIPPPPSGLRKNQTSSGAYPSPQVNERTTIDRGSGSGKGPRGRGIGASRSGDLSTMRQRPADPSDRRAPPARNRSTDRMERPLPPGRNRSTDRMERPAPPTRNRSTDRMERPGPPPRTRSTDRNERPPTIRRNQSGSGGLGSGSSHSGGRRPPGPSSSSSNRAPPTRRGVGRSNTGDLSNMRRRPQPAANDEDSDYEVDGYGERIYKKKNESPAMDWGAVTASPPKPPRRAVPNQRGIGRSNTGDLANMRRQGGGRRPARVSVVYSSESESD